MRISSDVYLSTLYPGSWLGVCVEAGLIRVMGAFGDYRLEMTTNVPLFFARPVGLEEVLPPLHELVLAEAYDGCTLDGSPRREWAKTWLRDLGVTDRGLELLLDLMRHYARPRAASLAAQDGMVR